MRLPVERRLDAHLASWLGAWPPVADRGWVDVVGSPRRTASGWDGSVVPVLGVITPDGGVLSVPSAAAGPVRALVGATSGLGDPTFGPRLAELLDRPGATVGRGVFRWSTLPAPLPDVGQWLGRDDPRVPAWLRPFSGQVLVALDDEGRYGAGVGIKEHDPCGHELSVGTEESLRGRGLARRLVVTAARAVLARGGVPTYLHAPDNAPSARAAAAAGFDDRGWQVLALWG